MTTHVGRAPVGVQRSDVRSRPAVPRSTAIQRPSAPGVGGTWVPLGPKPVVGAGTCCFTNPTRLSANYGTTSGRVTSIATDPANGLIVYAGTAGGGVWKSIDGGANWVSTTAGQTSLAGAEGASAIGALAIDPNNSQIVYAGTGEDNQSDSQAGWGILKTIDGGTTWTNIGSGTFARQHIGGLVVDKLNSQRIFAATDIGLYRSIDGGTTWTKVTLPAPTPIPGLNATQAATQIIQDPSNPAKFWVSVTDFCVGDAGDIMTGDGASTWSISPIKYTGLASRIGLGVAPNGVAYFAAAVCGSNGLDDIEKTTDGGATWSHVTGTPVNYFDAGAGGQGDYDNVVAIDPFDTTGNTVIFGGINALATLDGGSTFVDITQSYNGGFVHPDSHAIAYTARSTFYFGTDGGVWTTSDNGGAATPTASDASHWTNRNATLGTVQFYTGSALDAGNLLGGAQDNGTVGSFNSPGDIVRPAWKEYLDGDGGYTAIDPRPGSTTIYTEFSHLGIQRGSSFYTLPPTPYTSFSDAGPCRPTSNPRDPACADPTSFVAPFVMDPTDPNVLLAGSNRVYLTRNQGSNGGPAGWTAISGDVTTGTANFTGTADRLSVISMGPAGVNGPVITGSFLGAVSYTRNGSTASPTGGWTDITGNLPLPSSNANTNTFMFPNPWISGAVVNPSNPLEAWLTIGGVNVFGVWHTLNAGAAGGTVWNEISGLNPGTVPNQSVNAIALDPTTSNPSAVYVATDTAVMVCNPCTGAAADTQANWLFVGNGLPNVKVNAITFARDQSNLIAWTHGLGAWALPMVGWDKLGGRMTSRPVSTSLATSQLDTFVRGTDNQIWHNWIDANKVSRWEVLPGQVTSDASVVSPMPGVYTAFARGTDMSLLGNTYQNGHWLGWNSLGGKLAAEPAATAGNGSATVFVKGTDSHLWQWNGARPVLWQDLGGLLAAGPGATFARTETDAFVQGTDRKLWSWSDASGTAGGWHLIGGVLADKPVPVSDAGGTVQTFVRGTDNALWHWSKAGGWEKVGGVLANRPAAADRAPRLDALVQGTDNALWHAWSTGAGWTWEQILGAQTTIDPAAVSFGPNRVDAFIRYPDGSLWHHALP